MSDWKCKPHGHGLECRDCQEQLKTDARLLADMILNYGWHVPASATEAARRIVVTTSQGAPASSRASTMTDHEKSLL